MTTASLEVPCTHVCMPLFVRGGGCVPVSTRLWCANVWTSGIHVCVHEASCMVMCVHVCTTCMHTGVGESVCTCAHTPTWWACVSWALACVYHTHVQMTPGMSKPVLTHMGPETELACALPLPHLTTASPVSRPVQAGRVDGPSIQGGQATSNTTTT